MRGMVIAGNWKMNTTPSEGVELAGQIVQAFSGDNGVKVVIFPPATHLEKIAGVIAGSPVEMGAQNMHWDPSGAYTGELSAPMLLEVGCKWAIIGHSERRSFFGETDESVNQRACQAIVSGIRPIVCIGETLDEREAGGTFSVLTKQIRIGIDGLPLTGNGGLVIAYEPVWAIGTGQTASTEQVQEAHIHIRNTIELLFGKESAQSTVIQYGGSVNDKNATDLLACEDVDGALIGGASLKPDKFAAIIDAAEHVMRDRKKD